MELQRGTCFMCRNNSVLKSSQSQKAYKIISFLFAKAINTTEFTNVQTALRVCPICYHKLIIMKRTRKYVEKNISNEVSRSQCRLCKSEKNLFQINNWPRFSAISEEMNSAQKKNCVTCSDCLFYLETKNELKNKLFSKYPQLENKPLNNNRDKKKWKLKFTPDAKLQSTPLSERNKRTRSKRKLVETISISDDDSESEKIVNSNPLKNLKPLKDHKLYKNNRTIKMDSKFLNQIPYVLINSSDLSIKCNDTINEHAVIKYTEDGKNENCKEPDENTILDKLRNELVKHGIEKYLVVNVSRMKIDKYQGRHESDPEIQNLIDKFSILHSSNQTKENGSSNIFKVSLTETQDSFVEETETSFEIKNKRKSVSFAEEKNIEIEYFENESNIRFKNILDEDSEVIRKKQSKGILKRDENMEEPREERYITLEEQNKQTEIKEKAHDNSFNKEGSEENAQNQEDIDETSKIKIMDRRNSYLVDEHILAETSDSDSDIEILSQILKKSIQEKSELTDMSENENDRIEEESTSHKEKEETRTDKPKPLSRKKRRNTVTADTNVDHDETKADKSIKTTTEDNIVSVSADEKVENKVLKREKPKPLSKKKKLNIDKPDGEYVISEDILEKSIDHDATTTEQPLQNENKSEEMNKTNTEDNIESGSVDERVENKTTKKEKPKPLSKKKKLNIDKPKDVENEISSENDIDINKDDQMGSESASEENTVKRDRPKPLSQKKKFAENSEDFNDSDKEESTDIKNISPEKDDQDNLEEEVLLRNDNQIEDDQGTDEVNEIDKNESAEENKGSNSDNICAEKDSSLEDKSSANNSLDISEYCKEVLEKDEGNTIGKDSEGNSSKPDTISDNDVSMLVNKYLIDEDGDTVLNTQKDDIPEESTNHNNCDQIQTEDNKVDSEQKLACSPLETFNEFKSDDLGISEVDNDNINSILSNMFPSDLPDDKLFEIKNVGKSETESTENTNQALKRKISDDELNTSKERKKKKVTFCDNVT